MKCLKMAALAGVLVLSHLSLGVSTAEAGPLLDWLRGRKCCFNKNTPPAYPVAAAPACGLQPGQCQVTCQQTCSRTVVNYVPYTAYRTSWEKVPVTQYRPVTSSDPCTGCSVTCMKPCTSYTWQMKQIPYTTYRPVYRQESYKVPVTYITQDCNSCNTCPTCEVPGAASTPTAMTVPTMTTPGCSTCNISPATTYSSGVVVPNGTLGTSETYTSAPVVTPTPATDVPANLPPEINPQSYQQRVLDSTSAQQPFVAPPARSAQNPILNSWDYSPVRLASYEASEKSSPRSDSESFGSFKRSMNVAPQQDVNSSAGWKSQNW